MSDAVNQANGWGNALLGQSPAWTDQKKAAPGLFGQEDFWSAPNLMLPTTGEPALAVVEPTQADPLAVFRRLWADTDPTTALTAPAFPLQTPTENPLGKPPLVRTAIIDRLKDDGRLDTHGQAVYSVYERQGPLSNNPVSTVDYLPDPRENPVDASKPVRTQKALDRLIDQNAAEVTQTVSNQIARESVGKNHADVINASLGTSRNDVYVSTLDTLRQNPQLAPLLGLTEADLAGLTTRRNPQTGARETVTLDANGDVRVPPPIAAAIVRYVDARLDAPDSSYQRALARYREVTRNAARNGVAVVVSASNEHEQDRVFNSARPGAETNFLAMSDDVIVAAATDDQGTPAPEDDTLATFSSRGDGRYNPTIAASGTNVPTSEGVKSGTSFSAPAVAAAVARIKQARPNASLSEIKAILRRTATPLAGATETDAGAGVLNADAAVALAQRWPAASASDSVASA